VAGVGAVVAILAVAVAVTLVVGVAGVLTLVVAAAAELILAAAARTSVAAALCVWAVAPGIWAARIFPAAGSVAARA
jgi:hypothetical protein